MRLVIQSVQSAHVDIVDQSLQKKIGRGVVIYLGIHTDDITTYPEKIEKIIKKLPTIKFLVGETETIDQSLNDIQGEILLISNFTVYGRNHKGTKMDFVHSAPFEKAKIIYEYFVSEALKA
ncbi:MAG: D-aminoacyl-tRNA deacylase [Candidatus Peribacteria bacterium]|jgi:D-tyrosyl-tRNA(Tyr) deacylase|nr:D-aminoacyl-tRNA deacylase [Candidatus Peribacteria bacterium]